MVTRPDKIFQNIITIRLKIIEVMITIIDDSKDIESYQIIHDRISKLPEEIGCICLN